MKPKSNPVALATPVSEFDWLEPLDRRIEETKRETETIRKANEALKRLYDNNDKGMKRLADDDLGPN